MTYLFYCKDCDIYQSYCSKNKDDSHCIHSMLNYELLKVSLLKYIWLKLKGKIYE